MKDLLNFMLKGILGDEKFEIVETTDEATPEGLQGRVIYTINTDPKNIGMIIGKGGHMIKALRNVLKIRATLEKSAVALNVGEPQV